jgi:hypothetical protein
MLQLANPALGVYSLFQTVSLTIDTTPPVITINTPYLGANYNWFDTFTVSYTAVDLESGIKEVSARIDQAPVGNGAFIHTENLGFGNHIIIVTAVNNFGLESIGYATFKVHLPSSIMSTVMNDYVTQGLIIPAVAQSLLTKLTIAEQLAGIGDITGAIAELNAYINELNTQPFNDINPSIMPFLFQLAKNNISNLLPPTSGLPETLPYIFKSGYTQITLPSGTQAITIPLTGPSTIAFTSTLDPNIINYSITAIQVQSGQFQLGSDTITYTCWLDPNNQSTGSINLATGLVTAYNPTLFTLNVNGYTHGPYSLSKNLIGVQQWPDIYTASMFSYERSKIPPDVPDIAGATVEDVIAMHQASIATLKVEIVRVSENPAAWNVYLTATLTDCAPDGVIITHFDAKLVSGHSNEWYVALGPFEAVTDTQNSRIYRSTETIFVDNVYHDDNKDISCIVEYKAYGNVCNPVPQEQTFKINE